MRRENRIVSDNELMMARLKDLEKRIVSIEERIRLKMWDDDNLVKEEELVNKYGEYVDKTVTAKILGVTRATVYAMLADGRIQGACSGRRVSVRSIARYMAAPKRRGKKEKKEVVHED